MATYSVQIDTASISAKMLKALESPQVAKIAYDRAYSLFYRAKKSMMKQFNEHPITVELEMGPDGLNVSDTLEGYGNLFSFLGFFAEDRPTENLRQLLEEGTTFRKTIVRNSVYYFQVALPGMREIETATPMTWEIGNSWATAVEHDISGFSNYMYKEWAKSRSGTGFQLPYENLEGAIFQAKPYITEILANFREKVNNS